MIHNRFTTRKSQIEITSGEYAGKSGVVVGLRQPNDDGGHDFYLVNIGKAPVVEFVQVTPDQFILIKI